MGAGHGASKCMQEVSSSPFFFTEISVCSTRNLPPATSHLPKTRHACCQPHRWRSTPRPQPACATKSCACPQARLLQGGSIQRGAMATHTLLWPLQVCCITGSTIAKPHSAGQLLSAAGLDRFRCWCSHTHPAAITHACAHTRTSKGNSHATHPRPHRLPGAPALNNPTFAVLVGEKVGEGQAMGPLRLGMLPIRDPAAHRMANLITRPNHK